MFTKLKTMIASEDTGNEANSGKLGTFGGVFTPSILTILGVIMYLRFGWVVGNVGLIGTLIIVTLATSITFLTALSITAIATDQKVRIGGAYYMISRSLGIESGGAIGIPLYIAQALSVALYTVGFAESVTGVFPDVSMRTVGLVTTVLVAGIAIVSAKTAIKAQYFIMFGIALSLLSLLFGSPIEESSVEMWGAADRHSEGFWIVFAVFFPAVTGIMAGVNMSGDLKEPNKSIPRGTFAAIGVGYIIYMILPVILATRADALTLIEDPLIMRRMAYWGDAILIGVWGATLSSALGSILGAPRILQALARDGILPRWLKFLGRGDGNDDSPRIGTLFTMGIALVAVFFGNLNIIAPILTMFFLTTYGVVNITAGIERLLDSPSFRPKVSVHWSFSILGAIGCIAVMFLINVVATVVAFIFVILIFVWLRKRELTATWGDVRSGIWMTLTRAGLMQISRKSDSKTWRPHPLVLSGAPTKRFHLIEFASEITHNRGILTVATTLTTPGLTDARKVEVEDNIRDFLSKTNIQGLVKAVKSENAFEGGKMLADVYGLGGLVPNTIVLGDSENPEYRNEYCDMIAHFYRLKRNVLIVRDNPEKGFGRKEKIDLWWGGLKGNGGLMILLAYLLQQSRKWNCEEVNIKMAAENEIGAKKAQENIRVLLEQFRIDAKVNVYVMNGRPFDEILHENSSEADVIFMGMATPDENFEAYYTSMQKRLKKLPTTILVLAAEDVSFGTVLMQQEEFVSKE